MKLLAGNATNDPYTVHNSTLWSICHPILRNKDRLRPRVGLPYVPIRMIKESAVPITYTVAGGTVFLGMTVEEWGIAGVVIGIVITLSTFAVTVYFKRQHLKLARKNED